MKNLKQRFLECYLDVYQSEDNLPRLPYFQRIKEICNYRYYEKLYVNEIDKLFYTELNNDSYWIIEESKVFNPDIVSLYLNSKEVYTTTTKSFTTKCYERILLKYPITEKEIHEILRLETIKENELKEKINQKTKNKVYSDDSLVNFGKYKKQSINFKELLILDKQYFNWIINNTYEESLKQYLTSLLKEYEINK